MACRLDSAGLAVRREEWAAIRPARTGRRRTARTLVTTWRRDDRIQAEVERLVAAERECCPFLGLELIMRDASVTLVTSFPEGLSPDDWEW